MVHEMEHSVQRLFFFHPAYYVGPIKSVSSAVSSPPSPLQFFSSGPQPAVKGFLIWPQPERETSAKQKSQDRLKTFSTGCWNDGWERFAIKLLTIGQQLAGNETVGCFLLAVREPPCCSHYCASHHLGFQQPRVWSCA